MLHRLSVIALLIFFTSSIQAQIVTRTEDRAKEKTNQRVDQKIDRGIDSGLDAIEGLFKKKKSNDAPSGSGDDGSQGETDRQSNGDDYATSALMKLMGGGGRVEVADAYHFDQSLDMVIESYDKKGKHAGTNEMTMMLSNEESYTAMSTNMEGSQSYIIFDTERMQMVSLVNTNGQKMGFAISLDPGMFDDDTETPIETVPTLSATGREKKIAGYNCKEYLISKVQDDEAYETHVWLTRETDVDWINAFGKMAKNSKEISHKASMPSALSDGAMMEMVSQSRQNGEKSIVTITGINKSAKKSIQTSGYMLMNMGGN